MPLVIIVKALYEEVYLTGLKRPEADEDSVTQVVNAGLSRSDDEPAKALIEPVAVSRSTIDSHAHAGKCDRSRCRERRTGAHR